MSSTTRHWAQIEEASFVAGIWFLFGVQRLFGRWPFRLFLYPVVIYYWALQSRARRASREYLDRLAACSRDATPRSSFRHFIAFAEALMDKLLAWSGRIGLSQADLEGADVSKQAVLSGRGGLIVTAHLGNLELSRIFSKRHQTLRLNILVHTRHADSFNRLMGKLNPHSQINLIQVSEISPATAILLAEKVAAGEFVVIAGDRIPISPRSPVVMAPFLGRPAPFPAGPWLLASLLKCPVYCLWSARIGSRYWVKFERFRDGIHLDRKRRGPEIQALAADFAARMESVCHRAPYQWFNFFDFWAIPSDMPYNVLAQSE